MFYPNATWWRCTHQNKSGNSFIQGLLFKNLQKIISNSAPCWLKHHCEISLKKIHQLRNTVTNRTTWTGICNESVTKNNCRMVLVVFFSFFCFPSPSESICFRVLLPLWNVSTSLGLTQFPHYQHLLIHPAWRENSIQGTNTVTKVAPLEIITLSKSAKKKVHLSLFNILWHSAA